MSPGESVLRLGVAVLAGALIGLERQWRSRGAGLRTNTLVAGGAAMFVLISSLTPDDNSPTRIASYVVSGVGFLGAGVIISDGVSVRGINTAATLWCAAAAGALAGSGFVWEAGIATAAVLAINLALRPLGRLIDRASIDGDSEVETTYRFRATTKGSGEAHVRALLLQSISRRRVPPASARERRHRRHRFGGGAGGADDERAPRRSDRGGGGAARTGAERDRGPLGGGGTRSGRLRPGSGGMTARLTIRW